MASIVDRDGAQRNVPGAPDQSEEALGRMRSVVIIGLKSQGYDFRAIGEIMNLSPQWVGRLYRDVPSASRGFYAASATN